MNDQMILQMSGISKSYGGTEVLHDVDFTLMAGEVHVLIGENGAGKSTLMKILSGVETMDRGQISLLNDDGQLGPVNIRGPVAAQELGIKMVFQESNLIDNVSIAENLYLGKEPLKNGLIDWKTLYDGAREQLKTVQCSIGPKIKAGKLSVAEKQTVEIAKAISGNARMIILDEPTSSLSDREVDILFDSIRRMKARGIGIIYISHRMEEIFSIGDRITVFRDGYHVGTVNTKDTTQDELVRMMIGRELEADDEQAHSLPADTPVVLQVRDVHVAGNSEPVQFDLHRGEILGVFGLVGAGRTELARMLFGIDPIGSGRLIKNGKEIVNKTPHMAIRNGFALLPEDRKRIGLIGGLSIRQNIVLAKLWEMGCILLGGRSEQEITAHYLQRLSVAARGQEQAVRNLSGGNQQKVVYAKWLATNPEIMILDEPTRGIDVAAKADIYQLMRALAREGVSIIMISSDLPEILRVSNRVMVMHDRRVTLTEMREKLDQKSIMDAAIQ